MKAILRNLQLNLKPSDVERAAKQAPQGWGRKYAVVVRGRYYPPKDLMLALVNSKYGTKLLKIDFTTEDAARTLRRLGFPVIVRPPKAGPTKLSSLTGLVSLGGNAVTDAEKYYE